MAAPFITVSRSMPLAIDVAGQCRPLVVAHPVLGRCDTVMIRPLPWETEVEIIIGVPAVVPGGAVIPERFALTSPKWTILALVHIKPCQVDLSDDDIESLL